MKSWKRWLGLAGVLAVSGAASSQTWNFAKMNPKATYLRDSQAAPGALTITINPLDNEGMWLELRTVGWFNRAADNPASNNISNQAVAVFSTTGWLDPDWSKQFRVGGAADAGEDFYTLPTFVGNQPTDIAQDFGVGPEIVRVEIPNGAYHVLFTPYDNGFWNNRDDFSMPGADPRGFGIEWRTVSVVPEPASVAVVGVGLLSALRSRRKRS